MFYHFNQNNSGGSFDFDKEQGITHHVIIEADNANEANSKAISIGLYFDGSGDCPCCGDRWSSAWDDDDGDKVPTIYSMVVGPTKTYYTTTLWMPEGQEVAIHYKDGHIVWPPVEKVSYSELDKIRK